MKIDAHQHFWKFTEAEFGWIEDASIKKDFYADALVPELRAAGLDGTVAVQARFSLEETRWLLELAQQHAFIKGVVGWVDWSEPDALAVLEGMPGRAWLKGLRLAIQGGDPALLEDAAVNRNVAQLADLVLACDLLLTGDQLPAIIPFVQRHPEQSFIIDHCAKPAIQRNRFDEAWAADIATLAERPNVHCKVSGLVTEVRDAEWSAPCLWKYIDQVHESFGVARMVFGSDWPVCLSRAGYGTWVNVMQDWLSEHDVAGQDAFWGGNAVALYKLNQGENNL